MREAGRDVTGTDDWTDRNQHDPGVTLLELFAWLAGALAVALYAYRKRRWRWPP